MTTSFDNLMKNILKPYFKQKGFNGKGLNFYKTTADVIFLFNFQKSQGNSSTQTKFYINVGIHSPAIDETLGDTALLAPKEYECYFRKRISALTGAQQDGFYITAETDINDIGLTLIDDLEMVLHKFEQIGSTSQLCDLMILENGLQHYEELLKYFVITKDHERIKSHLTMLYRNFRKDKRWPIFERKSNEILQQLTPVATVETILTSI